MGLLFFPINYEYGGPLCGPLGRLSSSIIMKLRNCEQWSEIFMECYCVVRKSQLGVGKLNCKEEIWFMIFEISSCVLSFVVIGQYTIDLWESNQSFCCFLTQCCDYLLNPRVYKGSKKRAKSERLELESTEVYIETT